MSEALAAREEYRLKHWAQPIHACRESGLSNREFWRENSIAEKTFYYWLRKLRLAAVQQEASPKLIKLGVAPYTLGTDIPP